MKICQYLLLHTKMLKLILLFEICPCEICKKFVYKHSETKEYVKNQPIFLRNSQTSRANNFRILRIKNAKFLGYWFYVNSNIYGDFQICISVPFKSFCKLSLHFPLHFVCCKSSLKTKIAYPLKLPREKIESPTPGHRT